MPSTFREEELATPSPRVELDFGSDSESDEAENEDKDDIDGNGSESDNGDLGNRSSHMRISPASYSISSDRRSSLREDLTMPSSYESKSSEPGPGNLSTKILLSNHTDTDGQVDGLSSKNSIESFHHLGSVVYSSYENDCVLIKIENPDVRNQLESMSASEDSLLDWQNITMRPNKGACIVAHLTSGDLSGTLSATSSYTRLPYSTTFMETYVVRLNGPLSYGDCGSTVVDAITGELLGYIIAGCRRTGSAYIMAAHQVASVISTAFPKSSKFVHDKNHIAAVPRESTHDNRATTSSNPSLELNSLYARRSSSEGVGSLWPSSFFIDWSPYEQISFLEARRQINPSDDDILTFARDYDEDTAEEEVITKFCSGVHHSALTNPRAHCPRNAWLDDRKWQSTSTPDPLDRGIEGLSYREYDNFLDAMSLFRYLERKVCTNLLRMYLSIRAHWEIVWMDISQAP